MMADENTTGEGNQPEAVLAPETTPQDITAPAAEPQQQRLEDR